MSKTEKPADLAYVGDGYLNGIPARDLTADEIEQNGWKADELIASGLYEAKKPAKGKE